MPMGVRVHRVGCVPAGRLVRNACVRHRPVIRSQHHAAQRCRSVPLRRGGDTANRCKRQQKNRCEQECVSHALQPLSCSLGDHHGRIMPRAGPSADASISTLSVERVRQPVPSPAENVPHHQPAFSDRCTISGFFFSIRSAEPPQDHACGPRSMEYWNFHFH